MPCNSDYMNPNEREEQNRLMCKLIIFVHKSLGIKPKKDVGDALKEGAASIYGSSEIGEDALANMLCNLCTNDLSEDFIYNGRDKNCRKLAEWWDRHKEADKKRKKAERAAKKDAATKQQAIDKLKAAGLSPKEIKSLLKDANK